MYSTKFSRSQIVLGICLIVLLPGFLISWTSRGSASSSWRNYRGSFTANTHSSVWNETLGFQKILVVNLPSRTDTRDAMSLSASMLGLKFEYVDGVTEFDSVKALPNGPEGGPKHADGVTSLDKGNFGSWRAHLNAIRTIVEQNLTSALIMEDDADWDIRIKSQLQSYAKATSLLIQPVAGTTNTYLDLSIPRKDEDDLQVDIELDEPARPVTVSTSSPYGDVDRWDVLWMGHCGNRFPAPWDDSPLGRVVISDDETALEMQHYDSGYGLGEFREMYPNHTRVVSYARGTVCNLAYAVSLPGARKLLYDMGVANMTSTTDTMLREICDGVEGRPKRNCLSVIPPLFDQHRPKARPMPYTANIRWSTRVNLKNLVDGKSDYHDTWPDGERPQKFHD